MLTTADIPPGGEGEVQVTFSTGRKMGRQRKTITITSNDPNNSKTKVYVEAYIEVIFGFESYGLNMGKIPSDEPITKTINLLIKDPDQTQVTELTTSSEFITATLAASTLDDTGSKNEVEVTVSPGIPPGRINESVTARSNLEDYPETTVRITGEVQGDISLVPDLLRFDRYPSDSSRTTWAKTLEIVNKAEDKPLQVLSVNNPAGHLKLDLETVEPGEHYKVIATLNEEALLEGTYFSGTINIRTDNPEQEMVEARYMIYNR